MILKTPSFFLSHIIDDAAVRKSFYFKLPHPFNFNINFLQQLFNTYSEIMNLDKSQTLSRNTHIYIYYFKFTFHFMSICFTQNIISIIIPKNEY